MMAIVKDKQQDKAKDKAVVNLVYTVLKGCFLGAKGIEVSLNVRQAANLIAGGFIVPGKAKQRITNE